MFEVLEPRACLAAGDLDASFGTAGKAVFTVVPSSNDFATRVVTDSQGRTVVAGTTTDGDKAFFMVARLLGNGNLDTSFGFKGFRAIDLSQGPMVLNSGLAVAIDGSGRIIVAGTTMTPTAGRDFAVCRLLSNGALDTSFDGDGKVVFGFDRGGTNHDSCQSLAIDSKGRIVLAGTVAGKQSSSDFGIARLTKNGQLDQTFDTDGKATVGFMPSGMAIDLPDTANAVAIDSQGRIVVCGNTHLQTKVGGSVARLLESGQLDLSFGSGGKILSTLSKTGSSKNFSDVGFDAAGRILLAGLMDTNSSNSIPKVFVQRLKSNGQTALSFGSSGIATVSFVYGPQVPGVAITAPRLVVDPVGRLLLAATVTANQIETDFGVVRLTSNGAVDTGFGTAGCVAIPVNAGGDDIDLLGGVSIDGQGRIIVAGGVERSADGLSVGVARLLA